MNSAKNADVKAYAVQRNVKLWQIAHAFGYPDSSFSRLLYKELSDDKKDEIKNVVDRIADGEKNVTAVKFYSRRRNEKRDVLIATNTTSRVREILAEEAQKRGLSLSYLVHSILQKEAENLSGGTIECLTE